MLFTRTIRRKMVCGMALVLVMLVTWSVLFYQGMIRPLMNGQTLPEEPLILGLMPVVWIIAASGTALIAVSLVTAPPAESTLAKYFTK